MRQDVALQKESTNGWPHLTLCRFENRADREAAWRLHEVLLDQFIASKRAPKKLILDFVTDDPVHGEQDGRFFHELLPDYCCHCCASFSEAGESYLRPSHRWCQTQLSDFVMRHVPPEGDHLPR